jgi:hypothetical protein
MTVTFQVQVFWAVTTKFHIKLQNPYSFISFLLIYISNNLCGTTIFFNRKQFGNINLFIAILELIEDYLFDYSTFQSPVLLIHK